MEMVFALMFTLVFYRRKINNFWKARAQLLACIKYTNIVPIHMYIQGHTVDKEIVPVVVVSANHNN